MSLNSIILSCNKIKEIEENEPNSPPSITSLEKRKTMPDLCSSLNYKKNNRIPPVQIKKRKNKSLSSSLNTKNLNDIFFNEDNLKNNNSFFNKKNNIDIPKLNLNEKKENKDNNTKHREKYCITDENEINSNNTRNNNNSDNKNKEIKTINSNYFSAFKIYKPDSARIKSSYLKNITNNAETNFNHIEEEKEKNINNIYNRYRNKRIAKKYINKSYSNFNFNSNKTKIIKDIKKEFNPIGKQLKNIDNNTKVFDTEETPQANPIIRERLLTKSNINFNHMNYLSNSINKPYIKKKIEDAKNFESFGKKEGIDSAKRYSLQQKINKKRPLILNVNLQKKKNIIPLKISQFQRILNSKGILHILRFLDYYDIINLFKTKNKKMFILLNTALAKIYYSNIKECLLKYYNIIELLKCSIVRNQIKDSLKIDLVLNTRLKYNNNNNNLEEPMYYQLAYLYNYYRKIKPQKELITKEDCENKEKKLKMYDYYTFDLYPENYKNNDMNNNSIFISKELPIKEKDNNNLAYVQSILPFLVNDKGIINLELYTSNNGFIVPESIKIIIKSYNLKNYLKMLNEREINNPRISEYEELCVHWKNINLYQYHDIISHMCKIFFEPFFDIKKIYYENIGIYIFKTCLKAVKIGEINKKKIGIKIKIRNRNETIENEIRKNNLLFERRDTYEIRVGDEMIYYFSMK